MKNNMKPIAVAIFFAAATLISAQEGRVGINTDTPKTTLDVNGKKDNSGNLLAADMTGFQAPRLTREELSNKGNSLYGTDQKGTLIYITDISNGNNTGQRMNITETGYYYFDGDFWQSIAGTGVEPWQVATTTNKATTNTQNIYQTGNVGIGGSNGNVFSTENPITELDVRGSVRGGSPNADEAGGTSPIGYLSAAFGWANKASGGQAIALGYQTQASGNYGAIAAGNKSIASGQSAIAFGNNAVSSGSGSVSMGQVTVANGIGSVALGQGTIASSIGEISIGTANAITTGSSYTKVATDALFQVGNGASNGTTVFSRSNALTILKNGNIGTDIAIAPTERLDIGSGKVRIRDINSNPGSSGDNIVTADTNGILKTISSAGIVKVTTTSPVSAGNITKLVGEGSSYYDTADTGIILTSPNGSKFKITVNNDGSLNSTKVTIP